VLVFVESRSECDAVATELSQTPGFQDSVFAHHSSLSRDVRESTESRFQELRSAVCVATTTLELGIDIGDIDVVVLWGRATGWQSFLQRIGRGNRRNSEVQVICVVPEHFSTLVPAALGYQALMTQIQGGNLEAASPLRLYGAACQQIMSIVLAANGGFVRLRDLADIFAPWPHLTSSVVELVVDELVYHDVLQRHPVRTSSVGPTQEAYELVDRMEVWSNFPLSAREVTVFHRAQQVGRIPGRNLLRLHVGKTFAFGGRRFLVEQMRGDRIDVSTTTAPAQVKLLYDGAGATLDPTLAEAVWELMVSGEVDRDVGSPERIQTLSLALGGLLGLRFETVPVWRDPSGCVHLTCAGRRLNQLLAVWAGGDRAKAAELTVSLPAQLELESIPTEVAGFGDLLSDVVAAEVSDRTIFQNLLPVELLRAEALDAWMKTPAFGRTLKRLARSALVEIVAPVGVEWRPKNSRRPTAPA
jgi:ATP-dependent Lhr-like helicase